MPGMKPCEPGCSCKKHNRARKVDWDSPGERRAYNRQQHKEKYWADPERFRERGRQWNAKNPGRRGRPADLAATNKYLYGLSPERLAQMVTDQGGCCYLCGDPLDFERRRGVHVDHDHSCCRGRVSCGDCVRGLACNLCNNGIGHFGDDPERMRRVANHLEAANAAARQRIADRPQQEALPIDIKRAARQQASG